ncbi:MAG TPA: zinc ribbon domain-containing protein, partial [Blastocatellia bacterium]|nr:zinc ribbon domain-containing protein [Blastocatellia bacterium]
PSEVRPPLAEGPRPSGPLSGLNLTPDFVFTGALSRGVCLACGAESAADDLFCITCGVFIDEIGSTLPAKPTCGECKQGIAPDEIFCPWCGSVLLAA